jgi:hypothetical protein
MEYPSHRVRRRLRLFFAYGFKNSPETSSPVAAQQYAELAGRSATVGLVETPREMHELGTVSPELPRNSPELSPELSRSMPPGQLAKFRRVRVYTHAAAGIAFSRGCKRILACV